MAAVSDGSQEPPAFAANQALHIAEIIERILCRLPPRRLACARLVSRLWKNNIDGSEKCLQALFNNASFFDKRLEFAALAGDILDMEPSPRELRKGWRPKTITTPIKLYPGLDHVRDCDRFNCDGFTFRFWEEMLIMFEEERQWRDQFITKLPVNHVGFHIMFYRFLLVVAA